MLAGSLARRKSINGFIEKRLLEPASLEARHARLAEEMAERGFAHRSPLSDVRLDHLSDGARLCTVDVGQATEDLTTRCEACRERAKRR